MESAVVTGNPRLIEESREPRTELLPRLPLPLPPSSTLSTLCPSSNFLLAHASDWKPRKVQSRDRRKAQAPRAREKERNGETEGERALESERARRVSRGESNPRIERSLRERREGGREGGWGRGRRGEKGEICRGLAKVRREYQRESEGGQRKQSQQAGSQVSVSTWNHRAQIRLGK